jgi:uncharacterized protein (TIGR04255 family)
MSAPSKKPLPDFAKPPVTEVALSVQFTTLPALRSVQISQLWQEVYRDRFPVTEEHPPIQPTIEKFGVTIAPKGPTIRLIASDAPPVARYWFLNRVDGTDLVQVQQDRFVRNWRKADDGQEYPRYHYVRDMFRRDFESFQQFIQNKGLGACMPVQCEVTYVNLIKGGPEFGGRDVHSEVEKVIAPWAGRHSDDFLPDPENVQLVSRYIIPNEESGAPVGRLFAELQPVYLEKDEAPALQLNLIARGAPMGVGTEGILEFFDVGREWVVRGFTSLTTKLMHKVWERRDAAD